RGDQCTHRQRRRPPGAARVPHRVPQPVGRTGGRGDRGRGAPAVTHGLSAAGAQGRTTNDLHQRITHDLEAQIAAVDDDYDHRPETEALMYTTPAPTASQSEAPVSTPLPARENTAQSPHTDHSPRSRRPPSSPAPSPPAPAP